MLSQNLAKPGNAAHGQATGAGVALLVVLLLDLDQLVANKVTGKLELSNGQLEEIVRQAIDRELDKLVEGLAEAQLPDRAMAAGLDRS